MTLRLPTVAIVHPDGPSCHRIGPQSQGNEPRPLVKVGRTPLVAFTNAALLFAAAVFTTVGLGMATIHGAVFAFDRLGGRIREPQPR